MSAEPGRGFRSDGERLTATVPRGWSADVRDVARHPKPAVVFIDDGPWENFFHLAAALRKSGTRTVRVTVGPEGWQPDHLLFNRTVTLPVRPDASGLAEVLSTEYVADVQAAENLATTTYAALSLLPTSRRSDLWAGRSDLLDKFRVGPVLRDIGLRTPDTLPASVSGRKAVAELSLPIVLKRRVGASGVDVRIIESLGELEEALAQIECLDEWFFERFVSGGSMVCAGCVGDDGIELIATYEVLKRKYPLGPSSEVHFQDDAIVTETGVQLMSALKVRGFICFDIIRDAEGTDWIHDVNTRIFGGFSTCSDCWVRFLGGVSALSHWPQPGGADPARSGRDT